MKNSKPADGLETIDLGWRSMLREMNLAGAYASWGPAEESSLVYVLEAHRRLEEETGDSRTAAALTLAWAMWAARRS